MTSEIVKARRRKYYLDNKEKIKKQMREYYYKNIEVCKARSRKRWLKIRDTLEYKKRIKLYFREYRKRQKPGYNAALLFAHRYFAKIKCIFCDSTDELRFKFKKYTKDPKDVLVVCTECGKEIRRGNIIIKNIIGDAEKWLKKPKSNKEL